MKYKYLYQDRQNRNCEGWIEARNRENAYTLIRKQGIKPYRVIGDDPWNWRPWAIGAAFAFLVAGCVALGILASRGTTESLPTVRQQIVGDVDFATLPTSLDRYLAWFARPGAWVDRPEATFEEMKEFEAELDDPPALDGAQSPNKPSRHLLMRIIEGMKAEIRLQIEGGMTMQECCAALEERQKREQKIRLKAAESVKMAQENYRAEMLERVNRRLKSMGMAELGDNDILKK